VLGWYAYERTHRTPVAIVNGVYRNPCCAPVQLKDGLMLIDGARVPFDLEDMKFGLTAYPAHNVVVVGNQVKVMGGETYTAISVSADRQTLTLCGPSTCEPDYVFTRV
jgi:hypothetical protein